jgi:hypothetical protein
MASATTHGSPRSPAPRRTLAVNGDGNPPGKIPEIPMRRIEFLLGLIALLLWFVTFGGGIIVGTEQLRAELARARDLATAIPLAMQVFLFWTITNVGVLSCLAAFLGAFGRRNQFAVHLTRPNTHYLELVPANISSHYASAVLRGFGIYAMVMAGLLILATETFENPSQGGYLRIAATVSVMAFYAGYDPELFASVLQRVKRLLDPDTPDSGSTNSNGHRKS